MTERDIWVFGYGSLMWAPGFPYREARPARLRGYHRALCVYSVHYRGTPERPGLVLGLARGGSCLGRGFRVAAEDVAATLRYLDRRELVTNVYRRRLVPVLIDGERRLAVAYVADIHHPQYAGALAPERAAAIVRSGQGAAGPNVDYLANTVAHLDALGISDGPLHRLLDRINGR